MVFDCQQCGECCSHLGLVFMIKESYDDYNFLIYNQYTGDEKVVSIDSDKYDLFQDKSIFEVLPETCPFFRRDNIGGGSYCTVHLTRPDICREYGCWRLLILDSRGNRVGRVMQSRHLQSDSPLLSEIWDKYVRTIKEPNDIVWEGEMIRIMVKVGYHVRR